MGLVDDIDGLVSSQHKAGVRSAEKQKEGVSARIVATQSGKGRDWAEDRLVDDFETWPLSQLQDEARRYGFRSTQSRKLLLWQLSQVREALEQQQEVGDDSIASSSSPPHSSSNLQPAMSLSSDEEGAPMGDFTMDIIRQAAASNGERESSSAFQDERDEGDDDDDDDDDDADHDSTSSTSSRGHRDRCFPSASLEGATSPPPETASASPLDIAPTLSSQLHQAITSDKVLYHRILLFEPISFDEISSTAKRAGVTGLKSKEMLRNWLDMQGICFYSADLTGQRQRY